MSQVEESVVTQENVATNVNATIVENATNDNATNDNATNENATVRATCQSTITLSPKYTKYKFTYLHKNVGYSFRQTEYKKVPRPVHVSHECRFVGYDHATTRRKRS
jgi:hypothetical protein